VGDAVSAAAADNEVGADAMEPPGDVLGHRLAPQVADEPKERLLDEVVRGVIIADRGEGECLELRSIDAAGATRDVATLRVITGASVGSTSGPLTFEARMSFTGSRLPDRPCRADVVRTRRFRYAFDRLPTPFDARA
jgi:hypothetical protein